MNSFRLAIAVSLGVHVILFLYAHPFPGLNSPPILNPSDYHLPVSVELSASHPEIAPPQEFVHENNAPKAELDGPEPSTPEVVKDGVENLPEQTSAALVQNIQSDQPFSDLIQVSHVESLPSTKAWNSAPVYPESARRLKQEGRVLLDVALNEAGKVIQVQVARSTGFPVLDEAAIQAVRNWTLDIPAHPERRLFIPVTFKLESKES